MKFEAFVANLQVQSSFFITFWSIGGYYLKRILIVMYNLKHDDIYEYSLGELEDGYY